MVFSKPSATMVYPIKQRMGTDDLYKNLSEIVDEIVNKQCKTLDGAIKKLSKMQTFIFIN